MTSLKGLTQLPYFSPLESHGRNLAILTIAMVFISTSGTLGKFIALPVPVIIWWRCFLGAIFILIFCLLTRLSLRPKSTGDILPFTISALLLGAHWITYFYSLKLSNVAIGMLTLFTFPIMTALLEPILYKTKFDFIHIAMGIMVLVGIYILSPTLDWENDMVKGILLGLLSAFCYAIRNLIVKNYTANYHGSVLMFYQVAILSLLLVPSILFFKVDGFSSQFPYIMFLALFTTAIGHSLFLKALKHFKVSSASIIASAQPVFGIIIAFFFLSEVPSSNTVLGGSLILATVIIEGLRTRNS